MVVSIHQPNLFPWLGFFQKIINSDTFIYLDHTIHNPRNPLWTKRVQIMMNGKGNWLTVPLKSSKEQVFLPLNEMQIQALPKWDIKMQRSIEQNYSKAPFFHEMMPIVQKFFDNGSDLIVERNIAFIGSVCEALKIKNERVRSSTLGLDTASNQLLIDIVKAVKGTEYLAGDGAEGYQEIKMFNEQGLEFRNLEFQHPSYEQYNSREFQKGLSIIDALMNLGFEGVKGLLRQKEVNSTAS